MKSFGDSGVEKCVSSGFLSPRMQEIVFSLLGFPRMQEIVTNPFVKRQDEVPWMCDARKARIVANHSVQAVFYFFQKVSENFRQ